MELVALIFLVLFPLLYFLSRLDFEDTKRSRRFRGQRSKGHHEQQGLRNENVYANEEVDHTFWGTILTALLVAILSFLVFTSPTFAF